MSSAPRSGSTPPPHFDRRSLNKTLAWTVPAVSASIAAPAMAAGSGSQEYVQIGLSRDNGVTYNNYALIDLAVPENRTQVNPVCYSPGTALTLGLDYKDPSGAYATAPVTFSGTGFNNFVPGNTALTDAGYTTTYSVTIPNFPAGPETTYTLTGQVGNLTANVPVKICAIS